MRKRSKGRMCCRSLFGAFALLLCFGLAARASADELYGLVIGIDDYIGTENDLDGAVNDAKDVANSLNEAGAKEVLRLLNDDARKDRIVAAWEGLLAKAKAGDTIVFSYAGHGGQEPAPPDRHDKTHIESFLLGHFEPSGPGTRERIVDDEVFVWLQQADKKGVKVVFVAIPATVGEWSAARARLASSSAAWSIPRSRMMSCNSPAGDFRAHRGRLPEHHLRCRCPGG